MTISKKWFESITPGKPPLFLAPMAGVTHSALRRLIADFGGHRALFTEMLSPKALVSENLAQSPFTKTRPHEGPVVFQLRLTGDENAEEITAKLGSASQIAGIDINLGCPAPEIKKMRAGVALFEDFDRLAVVLKAFRKQWQGTLTIKCRLGKPAQDWQEQFLRRLKLFEDCGIDAITVHPRFADEKLKRHARWNLFPWIIENTMLPVIANGDICTAGHVNKLSGELGCCGVMIGRMAAVQPWVFAKINSSLDISDFAQVWLTFFDYCSQDFPPEKSIGRLKEFTSYYAYNFFFGHELNRTVQGAHSPEQAKEKALKFFENTPRLSTSPNPASLI